MFVFFADGYGPVPYIQQPRQDTIPRSPDNLTRGTIDLVSRNRLLRYCRLLAGPSQTFGFQLGIDGQNHIIRSIQPESPASKIEKKTCVLILNYRIFLFSSIWFRGK